jgi:hypothetical protein
VTGGLAVAGPLACAMSVFAAVLLVRPGAGRDQGRRLRRSARQGIAPMPAGVRSTHVPTLSAPMLLDLVAEVLASGASPPRAVAAIAECLDRVQDPTATHLLRLAARLQGTAPSWTPPVRPDGTGPLSSAGPAPPGEGESLRTVDALAAALSLSVATGAGPVALIRAAAEDHRRRLHTERTKAAHRLGVLVLLPTGLCLLPAFVLLTVVPLVIDLVLG